jgi:Mg-chelatase subunit ChlD
MRCAHMHRTQGWSLLVLITLIALHPAGAVQADEAAAGAVDVMLVIDNSGSMRKNDPQFLTPKTVRAFLDRLPDSSHVGMVLFDQRARLLQPLSDLSDADARQRLGVGLNKIDYRGKFTDSAAGIERAVYELKTAGRAQARQSIIFLTDGIVDTGDRQKDAELTQWLKSDLANECSDAHIRILGVAFTENADFPLIQALASRTGGAYFRATHAEDIADVLTRIEALLPPPRPIPQTPSAEQPVIEIEPPSTAPIPTEPEPPAVAKTDTEATPAEPREVSGSSICR